MDQEEQNLQRVITHWIKRSDQDYETMINLYRSKDYHWALFIGHLVVERLLKAIVVKNINAHAPFTHDLRRLAKLAEMDIDDDFRRILDTVTTFNLNVRYDDYKQDFYNKCTADYAAKWISNIEKVREWIKIKL
jgi:HEPN domain-containing protein